MNKMILSLLVATLVLAGCDESSPERRLPTQMVKVECVVVEHAETIYPTRYCKLTVRRSSVSTCLVDFDSAHAASVNCEFVDELLDQVGEAE